MNVEQGVRLLAGSMTLLSVALTYWVHPYFVWLTIFVGLNLVQSAFTGICPAQWVLQKLGLHSCCKFDEKGNKHD